LHGSFPKLTINPCFAKNGQSECQTAHIFFPFESTVSARLFSARLSAKIRGAGQVPVETGREFAALRRG